MASSKLDVVNDCLATMGQLPVDSINELYGYGAVALSKLNRRSESIQSAGWWFNKRETILTPNVNSEVVVPGNILKVVPTDPRYSKIGNRIYDSTVGSFTITVQVPCEVTTKEEWDNLPVAMQDYIAASTVRWFLMDYDASTLRYQQAVKEETDTLEALRTEHIKASRVNLLLNGTGGEFAIRRKYGRFLRG